MAAAKKRSVNTSGKRSGNNSSGQKRNNTAGRKSSATGKKTTGKKQAASRGTSKQHKRTAEEMNTYKDRMAFETGITILVISIIAVFFYLSFFGLCGKIGIVLSGIHFGLFGWISWIMPAAAVIGYIFAVVNPGDRRVPRKVISAGGILIFLGAFTELIFHQEILTKL